MFKKNLDNLQRLPLPSWRKMAMASWSLPGDSSTYVTLSMSVDKIIDYLEIVNRDNQEKKITLTHFIGKALAKTFLIHPSINRIFRFGRYYQRQEIDVFFLVASDSAGSDLTGKVIHAAHEKPLKQIAQELSGSVKKIREGEHKKRPFGLLKMMLRYMPIFIIKPLTKLLGFVLYTLNIKLPVLKLDKNPFGSVMVTSVGSIGLQSAYSPLIPYSRVPMIMSIGSVQKKLKFDENKEIVEERYVDLGFTVDHRIVDGVHGANMAKALSKIFEMPHTIDEILTRQAEKKNGR